MKHIGEGDLLYFLLIICRFIQLQSQKSRNETAMPESLMHMALAVDAKNLATDLEKVIAGLRNQEKPQ